MVSSQESIKQLQDQMDSIKASYTEFKDTHLKSNKLHPQSHLSILFGRLDSMFSEHQSAFDEIQAQIEQVTDAIECRFDDINLNLMSTEEVETFIARDVA